MTVFAILLKIRKKSLFSSWYNLWADRRRASKMWLCLFQGGGGKTFKSVAPPEKSEMTSLSYSLREIHDRCKTRPLLNY